jgi:hypothetical protein
MITCVNLNERFGQDYRVQHEDPREKRLGNDPWLCIIPCTHGNLYVHGNELLGAATNKRGPVAKRLAALPCVRVVQDGDDGVNVVFNVHDFPAVAAVMKPKRRRRLTPVQVAERTERLRQYRFSPASKCDSNDRRRAPAA